MSAFIAVFVKTY